MSNRFSYKEIGFSLLLVIIVGVSFFFYAPVYYPDYNSDHGIHVLMSYHFELPNDLYYWGQNRLGSLLPFVTSLFVKVFPIHPMYVISIINYSFLLISFFIIKRYLKSNLSVFLFAIVIFWPFTNATPTTDSFNGLLLVGHPYSSQLLSASIFFLFLEKLKNAFIKEDIKLINVYLFLTLSFFGFFLGIWSSEYNAILFLIPLSIISFNKELFRKLIENISRKWFITLSIYSVLLILITISLFKYFKSTAVNDDTYNHYFISSIEQLKETYLFLIERVFKTFLFRDTYVYENLYFWTLLLVSIYAIFNRGDLSKRNKRVINTILITAITSFVVLSLSFWNYRFEFRPRYFIPIYLLVVFVVIYSLDNIKSTAGLIVKFFFIIVYLFSFSANIYKNFIKTKEVSGFEHYSEFDKLAPGVLIGSYWSVYAANAIALKHKSIPMENETVRNFRDIDNILEQDTFYFIELYNYKYLYRNWKIKPYIFQYGTFFKYDTTLLVSKYKTHRYIKQESYLHDKFILKTHNDKFLAINPETKSLVTIAERNKAEPFSFSYTAVGKNGLKTSFGKHLCFGEDGLVKATSNEVYYWETIEVEINDKGYRVMIKNHHNKFLSVSPNNKVIANREQPGEWEQFEIIEIQNKLD